MTSSPLDRLVDEWLDRVERAAADLPPDQRGELLADLREHIAVARADLSPETEAGVRTILERLGDPAMIAEEARHGEPSAHGEPSVFGAAPAHGEPSAAGDRHQPRAVPPMSPATDPPIRRRTGLWIGIAVGAIVLVCAGCLAAGLGMFAWSGVTMHSERFDAPIPTPREAWDVVPEPTVGPVRSP
jgi:hypothetical protein